MDQVIIVHFRGYTLGQLFLTLCWAHVKLCVNSVRCALRIRISYIQPATSCALCFRQKQQKVNDLQAKERLSLYCSEKENISV